MCVDRLRSGSSVRDFGSEPVLEVGAVFDSFFRFET